MRTLNVFFCLASLAVPGVCCGQQESELRERVLTTMRKATEFFRESVATHGGYVYHYDLDLQRRWGEGEATRDQIWVQPPGTPSVGLAYVAAYRATGESYYRDGIREVAVALLHGQLQSGGWTNCIDFDPQGKRVAQYRRGGGQGKNYSSLDDGQTQTAIEFMVRADQALDFQDAKVHEATLFALDCLLAAQYPSGGFPQVWDGPVERLDAPAASYPTTDWRTEGRIKEYWDLYTLNDDAAVFTFSALKIAYEVYRDVRYLESIQRLGDFLILAQMPEPQPAWAQQYNFDMQPAWARAFEPPAIAGRESENVVRLLMDIYSLTGDAKYLAPIPQALRYFRASLLPDGRMARYYELQTNRPLYMTRADKAYSLTYDDSKLPSHYGWKNASQLSELESRFDKMLAGETLQNEPAGAAVVELLVEALDSQGRWVDTYRGERLVGQLKFAPGTKYIASETFSRNLTALSGFIASSPTPR